jgi:hypothetical protein
MVTSSNSVLQLGDVPIASGFYFNDSFAGATVNQSKWISKSGNGSAAAVLTAGTGTQPTSGGIAILPTALDTPGNGALRLTTADASQSAFVLFDEAFASNKGVNVTFDFFSYGGNGADGISFFLIDGSTLGKDVTPGSAGAGLGYAQNTGTAGATGLTSGYLGIGFDEFGNYSNPVASSPGGPGLKPDSIAVRGSSANGYKYLTGTDSIAGGIDNTDADTRQEALRTAEIDLSSTGILNVSIEILTMRANKRFRISTFRRSSMASRSMALHQPLTSSVSRHLLGVLPTSMKCVTWPWHPAKPPTVAH